MKQFFIFLILFFFICTISSCVPKAVVKDKEKQVVEITYPVIKNGKGIKVARYETKFHDPVLEEIRDRDKKWNENQEKETGKIKKQQKEKKEKERQEEKVLMSSLLSEEYPASPDKFKQVSHQPADSVPQGVWAIDADSNLVNSDANKKMGSGLAITHFLIITIKVFIIRNA